MNKLKKKLGIVKVKINNKIMLGKNYLLLKELKGVSRKVNLRISLCKVKIIRNNNNKEIRKNNKD